MIKQSKLEQVVCVCYRLKLFCSVLTVMFFARYSCCCLSSLPIYVFWFRRIFDFMILFEHYLKSRRKKLFYPDETLAFDWDRVKNKFVILRSLSIFV